MPNEFDPYACEVCTSLWEAYRREHPEAPAIPPEFLRLDNPAEQALARAATAYWAHTNTCGNCNEV